MRLALPLLLAGGSFLWYEWPSIESEAEKLKGEVIERRSVKRERHASAPPPDTDANASQSLRSQTAAGLPFQIVQPVSSPAPSDPSDIAQQTEPAALSPTSAVTIAKPDGSEAYSPASVVVPHGSHGIDTPPTIVTPHGSAHLHIHSTADVQKALNTLGFGPVKENGVLDSLTKSAIVRFQRAHGLTVDSTISKKLKKTLASVLGALAASRSAIGLSPQVQSATRASVLATSAVASAGDVQKTLNALGASPLLAITGKIDARTRAALKAFQLLHGLHASGIPTPKTLAALSLASAPVSPKTAVGGEFPRDMRAWNFHERQHREDWWADGDRMFRRGDPFGCDVLAPPPPLGLLERGPSGTVFGSDFGFNLGHFLLHAANPLSPFKAVGHAIKDLIDPNHPPLNWVPDHGWLLKHPNWQPPQEWRSHHPEWRDPRGFDNEQWHLGGGSHDENHGGSHDGGHFGYERNRGGFQPPWQGQGGLPPWQQQQGGIPPWQQHRHHHHHGQQPPMPPWQGQGGVFGFDPNWVPDGNWLASHPQWRPHRKFLSLHPQWQPPAAWAALHPDWQARAREGFHGEGRGFSSPGYGELFHSSIVGSDSPWGDDAAQTEAMPGPITGSGSSANPLTIPIAVGASDGSQAPPPDASAQPAPSPGPVSAPPPASGGGDSSPALESNGDGSPAVVPPEGAADGSLDQAVPPPPSGCAAREAA